jgi:hypothetical protein
MQRVSSHKRPKTAFISSKTDNFRFLAPNRTLQESAPLIKIVKVARKGQAERKLIDPLSLKIKELLEYRKKQRDKEGMLVRSSSMMDFVKRDLI